MSFLGCVANIYTVYYAVTRDSLRQGVLLWRCFFTRFVLLGDFHEQLAFISNGLLIKLNGLPIVGIVSHTSSEHFFSNLDTLRRLTFLVDIGGTVFKDCFYSEVIPPDEGARIKIKFSRCTVTINCEMFRVDPC